MVFQAIILFAGGFLGGLYGASVGGGALFTLPLLLLTGLPPQFALGTQRLAAAMLELSSSIRFHKAKKLDLKLALMLSAFAVVGSIAGVKIVIGIPPKTLNVVIGVLLLSAALTLLNKDRFDLKKYKFHRQNLALLAAASVILGFYGGFIGAGFGAFSVIALSLFGFNFLESAAISRVIGFCTSVAATFIFAQHHLIYYRLSIILGAGFVIGSWIGVGIALKKSEGYIRILLLLVIGASLIKVLWSL
ncbi:MAG TPA: sulfite exporter TauE/SafE family protein [Candidatus Saccharimonadales bacterium]